MQHGCPTCLHPPPQKCRCWGTQPPCSRHPHPKNPGVQALHPATVLLSLHQAFYLPEQEGTQASRLPISPVLRWSPACVQDPPHTVRGGNPSIQAPSTPSLCQEGTQASGPYRATHAGRAADTGPGSWGRVRSGSWGRRRWQIPRSSDRWDAQGELACLWGHGAGMRQALGCNGERSWRWLGKQAWGWV